MAAVKTAVSLDADLLQWAEARARNSGKSRSGIVSEALLALRRREEDELLFSRLNQAYSDEPDEEELEWIRAGKDFAAKVADEW